MKNVEPTHTLTPNHSHNYFKELFQTKRYTHNNKLILASIILFFLIIILILFIHVYARCYLHYARPRRRRRHHQLHHSDDYLVFYVDPNDPSTLLTTLPPASTGLSTSLIAMLPVFGYYPSTDPSKNPLECAVCLSEFREGEMGRVLPKCHHAFHVSCIDMWFRSHITCPLCRATVEALPKLDYVFSSVESRIGSGVPKPSFLEDIIIEYPFGRSEDSVGDSSSTQSSWSSYSVTRILPPFDGILGKDWSGSGSSSLGIGGGGNNSDSDDELNGGLDETLRVGLEVTCDECDDVSIVEEPKL